MLFSMQALRWYFQFEQCAKSTLHTGKNQIKLLRGKGDTIYDKDELQ